MNNSQSNLCPFFLLFVFLILIGSSCNVGYYDALTYNVPMESSMLGISEKGEIKVSGSAHVSSNPYGGVGNVFSFEQNREENVHLNLSGGYGFHKRFAVQSNSFLFTQNSSESSNKIFQQTLAVGVFYKHERIKEKRRRTLNKEFVADAYLGMGFGGIHHNFENIPGYGRLRLNYFKGYLHTGFSYNRGRLIRFGLSSKLVYTDYMVLNQFNDIPNFYTVRLNRIKEVDPFFHIELSPKISVGKDFAFAYFTMTSIVGQYGIRYSNIGLDGINYQNVRHESPPGFYNIFVFGIEFNVTDLMKIKKEKKRNNNLGIL